MVNGTVIFEITFTALIVFEYTESVLIGYFLRRYVVKFIVSENKSE